MDCRSVGGAVVGQHALDTDAVAGKERQRAAEERDRAGCFLVDEHFGVGQAGGVVDRTVRQIGSTPKRPRCPSM